MRPVLFILVVLLQQCLAVIYYLNETEFDRMPSKYHLDNYNKCFKQPDGLYCTVNFNLVSDVPSDLLYMIQEYSNAVVTHFNHTKLRYGICVSQNCQSYEKNINMDREVILEGCLNDSLWKDYELKARVTHHSCYSLSDQTIGLDAGDIAVAAVIAVIILLNCIGTVYENLTTSKNIEGKSILLCFSIRRNWKRLTSRGSTDPRIQRLRGINCLKCCILGGVTLAHSTWPLLITGENLHGLELIYYDLSQYIILNGPLMIQTYLVVSGFLLVYKFQIYSEKNKLTWWLVPKGILMRYLRLMPTWAVMIALSATWLKFAGPGPFWDVSGRAVLSDCRNRWWVSLLFLNNYIYNSRCMMHTWYLAMDMQLYCVGLVICMLLRNPGHRRKVLISLFTLGIFIIAAHMYFQDLNAVLILSPENGAEFFVNDPTFNEVYKRGHTNIPSYVIGMALGYLLYKWQGDDIQKFKKYRLLYWLIAPITVLILLSGSIFYRDAPRDSVYIRTLYGTLSKPIFGFVAASFIAGTVLKVEGFYRGIQEWRGWTIPGRLSFCAFIIHFCLLVLYAAYQTSLKTLGQYDVYFLFIWMTMLSYLIAFPLWLLVEAPFTELTRYTPEEEQKLEKDETYSAKL